MQLYQQCYNPNHWSVLPHFNTVQSAALQSGTLYNSSTTDTQTCHSYYEQRSDLSRAWLVRKYARGKWEKCKGVCRPESADKGCLDWHLGVTHVTGVWCSVHQQISGRCRDRWWLLCLCLFPPCQLRDATKSSVELWYVSLLLALTCVISGRYLITYRVSVVQSQWKKKIKIKKTLLKFRSEN